MRRIFAGLVVAGSLMAGEAFPADKPVRVSQPAYQSLSFYVYKPSNLPKEFYATFDGYLVYKDASGLWRYGSAESSGIVKTKFFVGSVVPSLVKIKPYNAEISSAAPVLGSSRVTDPPSGTKSQSNLYASRNV